MSTQGIYRRVFIIILIIFLVSLVSAIRINEIELNPAGTDAGNEWVELFSDEEINLEEFKLVNNDGDEFPLEGILSDYFIVNFEKQWLDNKDERVYLYNNTKLIDKTDLFLDSNNNEKTWQFCDEWIFEVSTKKQENNCPEQEIEEAEAEPDEEVLEEEPEKEEPEEKQEIEKIEEIKEESSEVKEKEIIRLGSREEEKSKITRSVLYESSSEKIKKYAIYAFCLLLVVFVVILIKKKL